MSLYTEPIREIMHSADWPKHLRIDIIEYPGHLGVRFYRDNFVKFSQADQLRIAEVIKEVMETIRGMGVPIYMEKMEKAPNG